MSRRLTAKQEAFCHSIADGKTQLDAYLSAYDWHGNMTVAKTRASEEAAKPHVAARLATLRERQTTPKTLTRQRKLERLAAMVEEQVATVGNQQLTGDQLKAIELDARMQGHNEPEKLKVEGMGSLLQKIRRTAPKP